MAKANLLIVEDQELIAIDLKNSLSELGYQVVGSVSTGAEAVTQACALKPDIVIMDIVLQGAIDGITAAAQIKDQLGVPIVYLTAFSDDSTLRRAGLTEPYGYLLKPFKIDELRVVIEMTLYKRRLSRVANNGAPAQPERAQLMPYQITADPCAFLSSVEFLQKIVSARELRALAATCRFEEVPAHEVLTMEGDEAAAPFIVASGRVAMVKMSAEGKELTVELVAPYDPFGLIGVLQDAPAALTARAQLNSRILWIPRSSFLLMLEENSRLQAELTNYLVQRLRHSHELALNLAHVGSETRIAGVLCALAERLGEQVGPERNKYEIKMTRQELSTLVGDTVETTIRVTKDLERAGFLALPGRGRIQILDLAGLKEHCGAS